MLTLEEAIKHYHAIAEAEERSAKLHQRPDIGVKGNGKRYLSCIECAEKHRQLAMWLKVLKEIWDSGDCNDCRNGQCERKPKLGQLARFNCPHYVGVTEEESEGNDNT